MKHLITAADPLPTTSAKPSTPSTAPAEVCTNLAQLGFYGLNGRRLTLTNDEAYDLMMSLAAGQLDAADAIAAALQRATQPGG
jgi:hypothetical protein